MNGRDFLAKLDEDEKLLKSKADAYTKVLQVDDAHLTEDIRSDIGVVVGEVNLLLKGKLKQFRGLCQANVTKSRTPAGEPMPLDSDLEGFWDITHPLVVKVCDKFDKLDARKAQKWAPLDEGFDPNDVNNRARATSNGDGVRHVKKPTTTTTSSHSNGTATTTTTSATSSSSKSKVAPVGNDDLKKMIQERRKAAAAAQHDSNGQDVEIFVAHK